MSIIQTPARTFASFLRLTRGLPLRFSRCRMWSPQSVMTWLLLITLPDRKTSYRRSLKTITWYGRRHFNWSKQPTLASISQARRKLSVDMCRTILHELVRACESMMPAASHAFGERRLIAFDGSRLITPRTADTARKLHRFKKPNGERVHNPQGLLVAAVDVMRRLPLDWILVGKGVGERTAMATLIDRMELRCGDVAILDRGFVSKSLFAALVEKGVDIVVRMGTSAVGWKEVQEFVAGGKKNGRIEMTLEGTDGPVVLNARLVERNKKRGRPYKGTKPERMVILTTLPEDEGFDRKTLIDIYAARWGIESLYGEMKAFMEVENFHSGFVDGCEQEVAAAMIWMALGSFMQAEAERTLEGRRVVRADCLRAASDLVSDVLRGHSIAAQMIEDIQSLRQYAYRPKPGRHYPRECKRPHGRTIQRGGR